MPSRFTLRSRLVLASIVALTSLCAAPTAFGLDEAGDDGTAEGTAEDTAEGTDDDDVLDQVAGTVTKVGNFGFGLVPDFEPGTRYAPTEPLGEEFQHNGLRVRFSGIVGDPDESSGRDGRGGRGGRRWGTPIEVTHIELLEEADDGDPSGEPGASESAGRF